MYLGTERRIIVRSWFYQLVISIDNLVVFYKNESDTANTAAVLVAVSKSKATKEFILFRRFIEKTKVRK